MTAIIRTRVLRAVPASAGAARRFVEQVAGEIRFPRTDDAVACVSELVTNAVTHSLSAAGGKVRVRIVGAPEAWLRIEVRDDGPAGPTPAVPAQLSGPEAEGGRGLYLVSRLADSWGRNEHGLYWCQFTWQHQDLALAAAAPDQGSLFGMPGAGDGEVW